MTENEFLLQDRITKIQSVMKQYGQENFCISFSGGKDSCVLSKLVDLALPDNNIPRVYADTGIDWKVIHDFVLDLQKKDDRIQIIKPSVPIKQMLETDGYPFKSKKHSEFVGTYQRNGSMDNLIGLQHYTHTSDDGKNWTSINSCPKKLLYQFTPEFKLKVSDKCCKRLKEDPINNWQKENNIPYIMIGLMREEGGRRFSAKCLAFKGKDLKAFQPLVVLSKDWEDWFISEYNIQLPDLYYPPYNFTRTGCKGCPFNLHLQKDLDIIAEFFPRERESSVKSFGNLYMTNTGE